MKDAGERSVFDEMALLGESWSNSPTSNAKINCEDSQYLAKAFDLDLPSDVQGVLGDLFQGDHF